MVNDALLIDIGNTRIKVRSGRSEFVFNDFTVFLQWVSTQDPKRIFCADVSGQLESRGTDESVLQDVLLAKVEQGFQGLSLAYKDVARLGVDRWLAMLASLQWQEGQGVVVVDAGTALKIDVIDSDNHHLGGSIGPGLEMSNQSLGSKAAQLKRVELQTDGALGRDTESCISYGVVMSAVALIEQTVLRFCPNGTLLVSGGDRHYIAQHLKTPHRVIDNLVLDGLAVYAKHSIPEGI